MRIIKKIPFIFVLFFIGFFSPVSFSSAETIADSWSHLIRWRLSGSGEPVAPIHVSLLPNGRLSLFGKVQEEPTATSIFPKQIAFGMLPTAPGAEPFEVTVSEVPMPLELPYPGAPYGQWDAIWDSFYCSGHALMADGTLFTAGGTRAAVRYESGTTKIIDAFTVGLPYATRLNAINKSWTKVPEPMLGQGELSLRARWYPTVTRLGDDRMLVTGGSDYFNLGTDTFSPNRSVETYSPGSSGWNPWKLLSSHSESPSEIFNVDYTHVFQLPTRVADVFDILMFGQAGKPVFMSSDNTSSQRWLVRPNLRPGVMPPPPSLPSSLAFYAPNYGTSTVLLPLRINNDNGEVGYHNGSVLMVGGYHDSTYERTLDTYDPIADRWIAQIDMGIRRHHPSTVILPDGRILILAGHDDIKQDPTVGVAQYLDPQNNFSLTSGTASMPEVRGYHAITMLLPDGRVMVGGASPDGNAGHERSDFRYYSPDYMQKPRPALYVNPSIKLQKNFNVLWSASTSITHAMLIGLGSMTHSFDMGQRAIELEVVRTSPTVYGPTVFGAEIKAPATAQIAPPGYYMLFILDANRVPSVGRIIKVER